MQTWVGGWGGSSHFPEKPETQDREAKSPSLYMLETSSYFQKHRKDRRDTSRTLGCQRASLLPERRTLAFLIHRVCFYLRESCGRTPYNTAHRATDCCPLQPLTTWVVSSQLRPSVSSLENEASGPEATAQASSYQGAAKVPPKPGTLPSIPHEGNAS